MAPLDDCDIVCLLINRKYSFITGKGVEKGVGHLLGL